jgi:hypothetical protein
MDMAEEKATKALVITMGSISPTLQQRLAFCRCVPSGLVPFRLSEGSHSGASHRAVDSIAAGRIAGGELVFGKQELTNCGPIIGRRSRAPNERARSR